ncbi:ABC transporter ATP-binding protein [Segeticoccus rhizosphaerae]|uniref:ABC transporter ATP-binding protein n=1 Tax=Segeticoccus rhizosphaerae TaxID=1104777 RepID=UPI00192E728A|nr:MULTISPECIES: ABC transporter ATP-binding protein [Intrasporangiaceae]HEX5427482.1 ABC transporter ATP-binding protein [Pedococcus sp.]
MREFLRAVWLVTAMSFRLSPWQSVAAMLETLGKGLIMLQPLFLAFLVDGLIKNEQGRLVVGAVGMVASIALNMGLQLVGTHARVMQLERVGFEFDARIARITAGIPTLDHLESARYQDELQVLRDQQGTLGQSFNLLLNTVNNLVFAGGTIIVAVTADARLAIVTLIAVPGLLLTRWTVRWDKEGEQRAAEPSRRTGHLVDLVTGATPSAELRVFGTRQTVRDLLRESVAGWRRPIVGAQLRTGLVQGVESLVFFGVAAVVIAWMVRDAIRGVVNPGTVALAVMMVQRLQMTVVVLRNTSQQLTKMVRNVRRFLWLQEYADTVAREHQGRREPPEVLHSGIRVEGVSFSYDGTSERSLRNVTLDLPAGSIVALVGENGAGKSTLVKLLTGMHEPTEGVVRVDGTPLTNLDLTAWRGRVSGAFQDHARFELVAQESIGIGDLPRVDDHARVLEAVHLGAGDDLLEALPEGLDTQLGTTWQDGVGLSGGQWQRVAIARGLMRQTPLLLVLDEPTAALDAATEHALFERYAEAAREAGARGSVTLLVTHRFSTVASADLVVVLDQGRVLEAGTHEELIAARGRYAELYELQARGYR